MNDKPTKEIMLEGLKRALMEATGNLYRVFNAPGRPPNYEDNFVRGVKKNMADYERMAALIDKGE